MKKVVPLSSSFFFMSIIGFYISFIYMIPKSHDVDLIASSPQLAQALGDFGAAFGIVFIIMFIASMISLTYAPAKSLIRLEDYERNHPGLDLFSSRDAKHKKKK